MKTFTMFGLYLTTLYISIRQKTLKNSSIVDERTAEILVIITSQQKLVIYLFRSFKIYFSDTTKVELVRKTLAFNKNPKWLYLAQ